MGCTSSAPNMNPTTTAEKSIQFEEDFLSEHSNEVEEILYRADNHKDKTNVLPSCDNLAETFKLDRHTSTTNLVKQDDPEEQHNFGDTSNKQTNTFNEDNTIEDLSKLQKVVEIVVENMHKTENVDEPTKLPESKPTEEKSEVPADTSNIKSDDPQEPTESIENEDNTETTEEPTELSSPTQSESSRATRWEALADIAAELPPSLMVDPITGQIYSLSK